MKPIILSKDDQAKLFEDFLAKFKAEVEGYAFNTSDTTISIKTNFSKVAEHKIIITYAQEAYLKMKMLVDFFDTEVAWYGLVQKIDDYQYYVYDVKVCKQYVNGAKVDTEDEDTLEFFSSLTDEEANDMHFQAHSHVKMSTSASGIDLQNQQDVVKNLGGSGFYIFQIWNKNDDINTYLYDLDNNVFYDRKDVCIEVEGVYEFIQDVADLVVEKKSYPYKNTYNNYGSSTKKEKKEEKEEVNNTSYLPGYYDGYSYYYGGSDW